ncbi:hypothetical protein IH980_03235 [Patescibacteria group bacterium]|nr:hypothetical protein [Patescibacteria group bacterium]
MRNTPILRLNSNLRMAVGLGFVAIIFIISVFIRIPNMNRRLGDDHEWLTAQSLIALENLRSQGALKHRFRILQTYPEETNRFVWDATTRLLSPDGKGYYITFPPFSIIFAYSIFEFLQLEISVLNLQLLNILLHFIAALFVYLLLYDILPRNNRVIPSVVGSATFILMAPNLWFFSNTYSWDIIWHYFWIVGLFIFQKTIKSIESDSRENLNVYMGALALINFLTIYSEYQGLFFSLSILIFSAVRFKRSKLYRRLFYVIFFSTRSRGKDPGNTVRAARAAG